MGVRTQLSEPKTTSIFSIEKSWTGGESSSRLAFPKQTMKALNRLSNQSRPFLALLACLLAPDASTAPVEATLEHQALTILHEHCFSCHNEDDRKGGLILTSPTAINSANQEFDLLIAGSPERSALITVLAADADPHMPPKKQLDEATIDILSEWVLKGAEWDTKAGNPTKPIPPLPERSQLLAPPTAIRPVLALALSPDETQLAAGSGNEIVIVTDAATEATETRLLRAHRDLVGALAWHPTTPGRLASGGYRRVVYWNTENATTISILDTELEGKVTALKFSPDGAILYAGVSRPGIAGQIYAWSVPDWQPVARWQAHADTIFAIDLSPEGGFLASVSGDRSLAIWETDTGAERIRIEAHSTQIMDLSFSSDGSRLATAGADHQLRVWDWIKGDPLFQLGRHKHGLFTVHWCQDGQTIVAGDERGRLYRYTDIQEHSGAARARAAKEKRLTILPEPIQSLTANHIGDRIYAGTHDGTIRITDKEGKKLHDLQTAEISNTP